MPLVYTVAPGETVKLKEYDPSHTDGVEREEAERRFDEVAAELGELQELLAAAATHSVLLVFQGMDTSGKDGAIRNVLREVNPQGCRVESFKVPTPEELAHDFLWRVHNVTPGRGTLTVFNRSHYEDVLVVRVHKLAPTERIERRYNQINEFEELLVENDTILLKFFLHISKDEQQERLLAREEDITKSWKLSPGDWKERERWDDYQEAYELALSRCSSQTAPWYVVPANRKWFRNLAITDTVVQALRPYKAQWLAKLEEMSATALAELKAMRG